MRVLGEMGLARIEDGRVVFLDDGEPLSALVPPPSLRQCPTVWNGLEFLRRNKPRVALLLTLHADGGDFRRLASIAREFLDGAVVCGVETYAADGPVPENGIPRPQLYETNVELRAFQTAQFPWLDNQGTLMLPCEPVWDGDGTLPGRLDKVGKFFHSLLDGEVPGYSPQVRVALLHPLHVYLSIYRAWGLPGQFGHWLSLPHVQGRLRGDTRPVPLTLGAGHLAERFILQEYCAVDLAVVIADRKYSYPGIDDAVMGLYYRRFPDAVREQRMPAADLDVIFPLQEG